LPGTPPRNRALAGLGARLRAVREAAGLSGAELADALGAGWRQPKISKIETGRQLPTIDEVAAWSRVTGADPEGLLALRTKAAAQFAEYRDQFAAAGGRVALQEEVTALASSCTFLAGYQPSLVVGYLQIPAYMRALAPPGAPEDEVGNVIAAKVRRQAIMYESGREIVHVLGEAALRTRIGPMSTATLRAQLAHLVEMSTLPHHTFAVLPFSVALPFTPLCGWTMYDRDLVVTETLHGSLEITDRQLIDEYSGWLEQMLAIAHTGADAAEFCREVAVSLGADRTTG
jgi:transcriptional regulator with XRE-family HTH domain